MPITVDIVNEQFLLRPSKNCSACRTKWESSNMVGATRAVHEGCIGTLDIYVIVRISLILIVAEVNCYGLLLHIYTAISRLIRLVKSWRESGVINMLGKVLDGKLVGSPEVPTDAMSQAQIIHAGWYSRKTL